MSDWTISIPHRRRDESVVDVMSHCRHLPRPDDARVMRQIVLGLRLDDGLTSAGAVLDHIEALTSDERRRLLDKARTELGLESTEMADARQRLTSGVTPRGELRLGRDGMWREATPEPRWGIGPSGQPVNPNVAEAEQRRQHASDQSLRHQREAQAAEREAEADVLREHERAGRAQIARELPGQMRCVR